VRRCKRSFDLAFALVVLVAFAPALALIALAIRLGTPGPVLYWQRRAGALLGAEREGDRLRLHFTEFEMPKFRTMRLDAERDTGPVLAGKDDPRVTRVGRLLRRTRLDEVPQVVNILLGEMSFVGPRPERPEFVAGLEERLSYYAWRHFVRPGLTGWAQVNLPYGSSFDDARRKLEYDLYYVRHYSLLTDLLIVLRTATAGLKGAR